MAIVKRLISEDQVKTLQEISETLNAALVDEREKFQVWVTGADGTSTYFVNREQFLEDTIEWCLNQFGSTFEFLE